MSLFICYAMLFVSSMGFADLIPGQPQSETIVTPPSYEHALGKMLLTLLGLIVLIFVTVWIMRKLSAGRLGRMHANSSIKILEKRALSAKSMLYLLEVEGKQILVSESHLEVRPLSTLEAPIE
ncbi:MAG: flagellar biosynthetic protein FliO [Chlamydiales bacterium]